MEFLRSKRAAINLQTLQRAYEDSYQSSLRAILLETQNDPAAALAAWHATKRTISLHLSSITETPKTSQESALMSNIMDIERQCYDRISFLERGGPNTNPYSSYSNSSYSTYSEDDLGYSPSNTSLNGAYIPSGAYGAPSPPPHRAAPTYGNSSNSQYNNFSSANIADAYELPTPRRTSDYAPPPLPPKVSLLDSPLIDLGYDGSHYQSPSNKYSQYDMPAPEPPAHLSHYKSLDPGSQSSLLLSSAQVSSSAPKPATPSTPATPVTAATPPKPASTNPPRPPVMRRQVSRPALETSKTTQPPSSATKEIPVNIAAPAPVPYSAPVPELAEPAPELVEPKPIPARSTPLITPVPEETHERKTKSTSSIASDVRATSLTSTSSSVSRSPSPVAPPVRPMLLTLRSGKGTMKRFKEERKVASNAATLAWTAKQNISYNGNSSALAAAHVSTGNGKLSPSVSNNGPTKSMTSSMERMSLTSKTSSPKPRPSPKPTPVVRTPQPTKLATPTLAPRPASNPSAATTPKRPTPVTSSSTNTPKRAVSAVTKPSTVPTSRPSTQKPTTKTPARPTARAASSSESKTAPRAAKPATARPATKPIPKKKQSPPAEEAKPSEPEEELSKDELWLQQAREKVANVRGIDEGAAEQIFNDVVVKGDPVFWNDIAGLEQAKTSLKETVVYPFLRPDLFSGLREPAQGMLLFGPPGTGKTMLARAVATESNSTFFSISASSLTSKFLGESEKLVRALFLMARALAPAIIFVDEIDSLLSARSDNGEHETSRRIKTEFLVQWSALQHAAAGKEHEDVTRVLVLAATNLPWVIDEAARRRFVRRQYIPLPEPETRHRHLGQLLSRQKHAITPEQFEQLVEMTDGYSGSDLTALAKDAAMGPLRSLGEALLTTPTDQIRPIGFEDFTASMKSIRPSVSKEGLKVFEDWAAMYGSSGA